MAVVIRLLWPCRANSLTNKPTITITRATAYLFTDDIIYYCQDISDAYHILPLGLQYSPVAFSTATFGFLGVNLRINTSAEPLGVPGTGPYEEVD
jgi:hypothetical protein